MSIQITNSRQLALNWLTEVVQRGRSVNDILAADPSEISPQQKSLAKQLLFGGLRFYFQLNTIIDNLLSKPLKSKDTDLKLIILLGLYQLKYLSIPDHAAISESVELTRQIRKKWAAGMVNGILRRYQREAADIEANLSKSLQFQYAHPGWIVKKLRQDWPEDYAQILTGNNQQAPMTLRVNSAKCTLAEYLGKLTDAGVAATTHSLAVDALVLDKAVDVIKLPSFEQGEVSVQDAAAQLVVELLQLQPGQKVLDGCAAPGGKTAHILQRQPQVDLTAVEMSSRRAAKISQTFERLGVHCRLAVADLLDTKAWWDGELFERILLDVPCSASGVIRRNPDIKLHRKVTDIAPLVKLQSQLLACAWELLKPGGILVYATCSVFKDENQHQLAAFIQSNAARVVELPANIADNMVTISGRASPGYQILPGEEQMDGFYFCGLKKTSSHD